ncbi:thioesterase family protein [Alphaproteobacteria bacterium]|nr:thioesterase family protein [Alphaproteobacteria bacterium]
MKIKANYNYFEKIDTRFGDNDIFGHINNVIYYSLFDSVINRFLINNCKYDPLTSEVIAISPETRCKFIKSLKYPEKIEAGLSTFKIGNTSVIYDISLFKLGEETSCAEGYFVHVFVNRKNMKKKVSIPKKIRLELERISFKH